MNIVYVCMLFSNIVEEIWNMLLSSKYMTLSIKKDKVLYETPYPAKGVCTKYHILLIFLILPLWNNLDKFLCEAISLLFSCLQITGHLVWKFGNISWLYCISTAHNLVSRIKILNLIKNYFLSKWIVTGQNKCNNE